jgi:toxin-antitoxin system PIN domain toxin
VTPDVNLLIAATRDGHDHHAPALRWFDHAVATASAVAPLTLLPTVVVGFVRLVTNRRVFATPTPTEEALAAIATLLAAPHVRFGAHGDEWPRVVELCERHALAGDVVTDAWIAASVLQLNEHLVTFDRGFRRLLPRRYLTVLTP